MADKPTPRQKPSIRRARFAIILQGWALEEYLPGTATFHVAKGRVSKPPYDQRSR